VLDATETPAQTPEQERIAQLEEALAAARLELTDAQGTIVRLRRAYTHALEQLQLMRRRLFLAKAERADASAEQLAFDTMFAEFQGIKKALDAASANTPNTPPDGSSNDDKGNGNQKKKEKKSEGGRRNFDESDIPIIRVEISSPDLDESAERIGVEETSRLGWERGGPRRIVLARVVYKTEEPTSDVSASEPGAAVTSAIVAAATAAADAAASTETTPAAPAMPAPEMLAQATTVLDGIDIAPAVLLHHPVRLGAYGASRSGCSSDFGDGRRGEGDNPPREVRTGGHQGRAGDARPREALDDRHLHPGLDPAAQVVAFADAPGREARTSGDGRDEDGAERDADRDRHRTACRA